MNRIDARFRELERRGEAALIPFLTSGDPDMEATEELVAAMAEAGADIIELGLPFSDPLADGPTIQAASLRALEAGVNTEKVLALVERIRRRTDIPIVLMGYYNPLLRYGLERFARDASAAGVDGTIIPDLPLEEAGPWLNEARRAAIANIFLVAPNTPEDRVKKNARASRGFLYYVSVLGITGARTELPPTVAEGLERVRKLSSRPVCVGFGISRPEQVRALSQKADGIIVGSAIVKMIHEEFKKAGKNGAARAAAVKRVAGFVSSLKEACRK